MATQLKRATIYIRTDVHQAIKLKSAVTNTSISAIVKEALIAALSEDEADLAAFEARATEPVITYEELLKKLKRDGKI